MSAAYFASLEYLSFLAHPAMWVEHQRYKHDQDLRSDCCAHTTAQPAVFSRHTRVLPQHLHAAQVLLFYPADWSFVCRSEIISFNDACAHEDARVCLTVAMW